MTIVAKQYAFVEPRSDSASLHHCCVTVQCHWSNAWLFGRSSGEDTFSSWQGTFMNPRPSLAKSAKKASPRKSRSPRVSVVQYSIRAILQAPPNHVTGQRCHRNLCCGTASRRRRLPFEHATDTGSLCSALRHSVPRLARQRVGRSRCPGATTPTTPKTS